MISGNVYKVFYVIIFLFDLILEFHGKALGRQEQQQQHAKRKTIWCWKSKRKSQCFYAFIFFISSILFAFFFNRIKYLNVNTKSLHIFPTLPFSFVISYERHYFYLSSCNNVNQIFIRNFLRFGKQRKKIKKNWISRIDVQHAVVYFLCKI